jgi:RNA polymerase sigma-70 factor (ECF subfamily)
VRYAGRVDDLTLLDRWCDGDAKAGNELFARHFESLYRFFESKIDREIDDLVQQTFLACIRERDKFRRQSSFRTYLFAIARYTLYGYWKRVRPMLNVDEISVEAISTSVGTRIARKQDEQRLLEALRGLPLEQQLLLELHYWEGMERAQLAEVFEIEEATTRSRLHRARQALRERLAAAGAAGSVVAGDFDAWARSLRPENVRNTDRGDDTKGV